ncbi:MAG: PspC domain-containing protein, partial [Geodermatophilaceae bacterium]|nr:PspC domain-containing protein [Geodermatophilaceae bacterium]
MTGPDVVDATLPGPTLPARPPLVRRPDDRVVAGVCDAMARHLMVGVLAVRVVFVVLVAFGGAGVMAYAGLWAFMQQGASPAGNGSARMQQGASPGDGAPARTPRELTTAPGQRRPAGREHGRSVALLLVALGVVLLVAQLGLIPVGVVVPLLLGGAGVAVIWRQIDEGRRPADRAGWWRLGAGAGLLLLGLGAFLIASDQLLAARQALAVILVIVLGLVVVTAPWWRRLVVELGAERRERIRTQERAEVAAHLHDSVLQTLALIQRHVDSPREVTRLARGQERELRSWLYGRAPEAASRFAAALEGMAADVEDSYAVAVEAV